MTTLEEEKFEALEEAFDRDLEDSVKKLGNGNGKGSKKDQKQKQDYMTFKCSSRFRGVLHEAVLLNGVPVFIKYEDGQVSVVPNIEEQDRILRPPSIEEYPYEPIEFSSYEELKKFQQIVLEEVDKEILFQKILETVSLYIDQDEEIRILISADILWTYFQDLFPTTHYYDISGTGNGIGKSTIGHVFEGIAYRAVRMTDPSAANLYRILGKIEPGQCIIIADEADRLHTDKDMLSILKEGYTVLGRVSKINKNTEKQEFFFSYCFKIRIAEEPMRPSFAKGVIDRSFVIKAIKGDPKCDIKEVLHPAYRRSERLKHLHTDLNNLRKLLLIYRLVHFEDSIIDLDTGLEGRDKELCKPLLQLFYDTKSYSKIAVAINTFLSKKNTRKNNVSIEPVLYKFINEMLEQKNADGSPRYRNNTISVKDIWEYIIHSLGGVYDPDKKPNEFQSYDYDTIYRSTITKVLEGFGAERKHRKSGNILIFDPVKLDKIGRMYPSDEEGEVKGEGSESCEGNIDTLQPKNTEFHEGKVIQNCIAEGSQRHNIPSPPSPLHSNTPYTCPFCEIMGRGKVELSNEDLLERHCVQSHKGCAVHSQLDIEKFRQEYTTKK